MSGTGAPRVVDRRFAELSVDELHTIVRLRIDVFVVEQACAYGELDGRDTEPTARHLWVPDTRGVATYLRLLDDDDARRIGRVVTRADARGRGLAARLLEHALVTSDGPWVLDAQSHLAAWYAGSGFVATGPEFIDDGIPHVPMRRER